MREPWKTVVIMAIISATSIGGAWFFGALGATVGFAIGVAVPFVWKGW